MKLEMVLHWILLQQIKMFGKKNKLSDKLQIYMHM